MDPFLRYKHHIRAQLIFNPSSGLLEESPNQLMDIINAMQEWRIIPETYLVEPDSDLVVVIRDALSRGIRMFVVSGGDGTIERVAGVLVGTPAVLGIIPTGTRNNVALGLGIPSGIPEAVALLRKGRRTKVDVGVAECGTQSCHFLETCSIGLLSALYPASDDIQHGNLSRLGDFLTTLIKSPPAEIQLLLDKGRVVQARGHVVLVANFPYVGSHFQVAPEGSFFDGLLDILVFNDLSKLALLNHVVRMTGGGIDDPSIQRFLSSKVKITTEPPMPAMADSCLLENGALCISIRRRALTVMAGELLDK